MPTSPRGHYFMDASALGLVRPNNRLVHVYISTAEETTFSTTLDVEEAEALVAKLSAACQEVRRASQPEQG